MKNNSLNVDHWKECPLSHLVSLKSVKLDPDTEGDVGEVGVRRVEQGGAGSRQAAQLSTGIKVLDKRNLSVLK